MTRFALTFFGLVSLTACDGNSECADCPTDSVVGHDNDPCADCPDDSGDTDDTGDPPVGTASVLYDVYRLGVIEDCLVNAGNIAESSSTAFEVPAPADYTVSAGDVAFTSQFDFPVHVDSTGEYWAAPAKSVSLKADDVVEDRFDLFNLFAPGVYECSYDKYQYDASSADLKGEFQRTVELDPQTISVNQDGKVEPQSDPNMGGIISDSYDDDNYVEVEEDHLLLRQVGEGETYITDSEIGKNFFNLTSVSPSGFTYVADLRCDLEP